MVDSSVNHSPSFQSGGNLSVPENTTFIFEFNATDPVGDALIYSIPHLDDQTLFEINATTGALSFILPKDFESPEDNNSDNIYELTVQVFDGSMAVPLNVYIQVTDDPTEPDFDTFGILQIEGTDLRDLSSPSLLNQTLNLVYPSPTPFFPLKKIPHKLKIEFLNSKPFPRIL